VCAGVVARMELPGALVALGSAGEAMLTVEQKWRASPLWEARVCAGASAMPCFPLRLLHLLLLLLPMMVGSLRERLLAN